MSAFKLVGRFSESTPAYYRGTVGLQGKKRVYVSREDFDRFSPKTIKRWIVYSGYDIEVYEQIDGKWVLLSQQKAVKEVKT